MLCTLRLVGDADDAGLRDPFKRGRLNAVTKDIVFLDYEVADVDADTIFDPLDLRHCDILLSQTALDFDGAWRAPQEIFWWL